MTSWIVDQNVMTPNITMLAIWRVFFLNHRGHCTVIVGERSRIHVIRVGWSNMVLNMLR